MARAGTWLRSSRGFTIIELMVVMSIIVTLATIGMVQYRQSVQFAKESVLNKQSSEELEQWLENLRPEDFGKLDP